MESIIGKVVYHHWCAHPCYCDQKLKLWLSQKLAKVFILSSFCANFACGGFWRGAGLKIADHALIYCWVFFGCLVFNPRGRPILTCTNPKYCRDYAVAMIIELLRFQK